MDLVTKSAVAFLGLVLAGFVWWVMNSALRERRRTRAEIWARVQAVRAAMATASTELDDRQAEAETFPIPAQRDGKHHLGEVSFEEAVTVPMLLARNVEEIDPPLERRYMRDDMPTRKIVMWRGEPPPVWTAPPAQPLPIWFRKIPPQ